MPERLLVPGLLDVVQEPDGDWVLDVGPLADIAPAEIFDWKQEVVLIPRDAASPDPAAARWLHDFPALQRRVQRARWVVASPAQVQAARAAGHPTLEIGWHRAGGGGRIAWTAADGTLRSVEAEASTLTRAALGLDESSDVSAWERADLLELIVVDRITLALSDGAISLRDVELAQELAALTSPVAPLFEAEQSEIAERAAGQRVDAAAVVAALDPALEQAVVPVYGSARRQVLPAFTLTHADDLVVRGGDLHVPAMVRWFVDHVEDWEPQAAEARRRAAFAAWQQGIRTRRDAGRRQERRVWILIFVLLALGLLSGLLAWWAGA